MRKNIAHVRLRFLRITETFIYEEIRNIRKYNPLVFCIDTDNLDKFPFDGIRSLSGLNPAAYALNAFSWLWLKRCPHFEKLIREEDVALLHAQYGREGVYSIRMKENCGVPLITNFRGWDASTIPRENRGFYGELFRKGDLFLARSADMKRDLIGFGCPEEKIIVHHSAIDTEKFGFHPRHPVGAGEKVRVLLVGRFVETKGIPYALEAFARVRRGHGNMEFTIVGDGAMRPQVERMVRRLGLAGDVTLTGFLPHSKVIEEMQRSHIFISPSITDSKGEKEGTVNTFAEAQATGMPVIGTYHAGIPEVVVDGRTGFLVKERDAAGLADRLKYLVEHQELWKGFGTDGRKHVEKEFNIAVQARKLEDIYGRVLHG